MYIRLKGLRCCGYVNCSGDAMTGFNCMTKNDCSELGADTEHGFVVHFGVQFAHSVLLFFDVC